MFSKRIPLKTSYKHSCPGGAAGSGEGPEAERCGVGMRELREEAESSGRLEMFRWTGGQNLKIRAPPTASPPTLSYVYKKFLRGPAY